MRPSSVAGVSPLLRRVSLLLSVVCILLPSACETLHPDIVRGYTLGEGEPGAAPEGVSLPERAAEAPGEAPGRVPDFYEPGTGRFVAPAAPAPGAPPAGNITLNFENTALREVVKVILGDLRGENYTIDPGVQGSVTLQTSRPIAADALIPTLELLLRMNGAALVYADGLYSVVPREAATQSGAMPQLGDASTPLPNGFGIRIVPLEFIAAEEMQKILEPFASTGNIVRVDKTRNLIVVAGAGPELDRILETVRIFDVDWLKGMSVALFSPDYVDAETLAGELGTVFGEDAEGPLAGLVKIVTLQRLNALLVITQRPQYLERVREWVDRLDRDTGTAGRRLYVYLVQNGKAADLAQVLTEVFAQEAAEAAVPRAQLAPGLAPAEIRSPPQPAPTFDTEPVANPQPPAGAPPEPPAPPLSAPLAAVDAQGVILIEGEPIRIIADEVNNALLIMATAQQFRQVEAAMRRLDIPPLQVLIEATIAEITLEGELQYGLEWFFKNNVDGKTGQGQLDLGTAGIAAIVPGFSYAVVDSAGMVRTVLNALAQDSRLNVISSPSLMVLNNQTANIQVGDEVPVTTQQQQSTSGTASPIVNTIEFRNTGVLLSVTPRVNAGGLVIMEVEQEVSQVAPGTPADSLTPTISQRKITSTVAVQSGQTVVLGGLIREQKSLSRSGVPGLYNLPILGPLFGSTSDDQNRTELVVLITPRAVRNSGDAQRVTEEFRN
ncbi:MAG: type II secretion system secretin GspD, partial [Gammaproteobacteria bacterium]|nr:type II secretion system secretin GspD [Gammaproteobacteria bacterium]